MKNNPRLSFIRTVLVTMICLFSMTAFAQSTFSVKMRLVDSNSAEPVAFATVSITEKGQTKALKYVLSDNDGAAEILKVRKGNYILKAELMGYVTYSQELALTKDVDLGVIKMEEDIKVLDAASVTAVGNPIVIKKDTIEYAASSFKTSDNDMLEELLKKLPGVEVEADGSITANGETIKKITIDGKTFFLDDPQLASKNIPAKMIEKVKVVEKKSDQAKFTGIDDGEEETIIDLSMKPGMMQGWFGNLMAGGGHDVPGAGSDMNDLRYQGAAMVGRFTEDSQISIILNGNNTNNRGFNDVAGNMMGGMRGGGGMGRGMGGWGRGNGITTSWMGGLNGSFTLFDDKMDLAGNYLYNGSINDVIEEKSKITYLDDGSRLINNESGYSNTTTQGNRFGIRLEHKFSENTSILFEPQVNFGHGSYSEHSDFETFTETGDVRNLTNKGYTDNSGSNENWSTSGFLLFRQRLGKAGRTVSANVRYSFSNNDMLGLNMSQTDVTDAQTGAVTSEIVNQNFDQNSKSASINGRVVYTEPLAKHFFLEANYQYGWSRNTSYKNTFDFLTGELDSRYSNEILNRSITQRAGLNFSYQKEKFRAQLGASLNPTDTYNKTTGHDPYSSKVLNWSPCDYWHNRSDIDPGK